MLVGEEMNVRFQKAVRVATILVLAIGLVTFLWIDPAGFFTVKAPGFTFTRWDSIDVGLPQSEVSALLGEPFERLEMKCNSEFPEVWCYSRKRKLNVLFHDYRVYFDARHNVARKTCHLEF